VSNAAKVIGLVAAIAACGVMIRCEMRPPKGAATNSEYVGERVADELAKLRGGKGGKILLIGFAGDRPILNRQMDAFAGAISKHAGFEIAGREDVDTSGSGEGSDFEGIGLPAAEFIKSVKQHQDADIVASFIGIPDFGNAGMVQLFNNGPKLVVLNSSDINMRELVAAGRVYMAVVNKDEAGPKSSAKAEAPAAWFDRLFEIVSSEKTPDK